MKPGANRASDAALAHVTELAEGNRQIMWHKDREALKELVREVKTWRAIERMEEMRKSGT
jgi:hypothetical protein